MGNQGVFVNGVKDWYVAESATHAAELARERDYVMYGPDKQDDDYDYNFTRVDDETELTDVEEGVTKTAREWARVRSCGFLMTTEW
jgi:hypothetical protein